ncbi:hypothetical protein CEUSTIGMA_g817.t1 [Chlamydomonas eustigma]|uniref:TmcB/TmcC TPR repeats domain-containing protein n=1 Tax=Chlamydomonas eustigma TaxID=1157962 RepID=A0A250WR82_9CHLO|nr:hypothetical protein CEUSTIGMA_g817.t1 [Chlamydomonas eustigma]|eukprot:GAX73364.1 hypothetical protein CEUSTIGMA_g817.t1 [Chlamydomonas eustigma]
MSVYGSEAGNSAGGQDTQDEDTISQPHLQNSKLAGLFLEDEDQDYQREEASLLKGFFGERIVTWQFVTFKIILDLWQLLTLTINPQYGWSFNAYDTWWQVIDIIQLNYFMSARGLTFFLVCLYIFIALLLFTLAICIWVAWSFKNQVFDYVWPITFLRWFGVIFFQMLDILSMTFFLMTLDCQYFGVDPAVIGYNQEFPSEYCWSFPYVINVVPASISLIIFVVLAAAFQMGEMELNMMTKNMLGMAHSKAEVLSFLIKFLMTSASVFLNSLEWLSCFYLGCSLLLLYLSLKWEPYYHAWVNHTRAAVNGALLYSALVLVILVYTPMLDKGGDSSKATSTLAAYKLNCTIALVAGLAPAAVLAGLCSVLRLRHIQAIVNKFRDAPPGIKNILIHKFSDVREVEMCARCCRKWVDELTYDEDAINLAYEILKAGMEQLPGNAFMIILYSSFLIDVKDGFQSGLTELAAARKADKSFLESFALYSREQLHTQKSSGAKGSQGADLVSYVEQQRSYRMAMKVNKDTFEATSSFWTCLLKQNVQLSALTKKVAILDARVEEATATYRHLLQRSPDNWMLIRMYGLFLELVRNDPLGAARNYSEAERIRLAEEEAKHNAFLTESAMPYYKGGRGTDNTKGVIIMNAKCIVKNINKAACDVTGYYQKELQGKNVNILIPRPFSDQHDQYVKKHITN